MCHLISISLVQMGSFSRGEFITNISLSWQYNLCIKQMHGNKKRSNHTNYQAAEALTSQQRVSYLSLLMLARDFLIFNLFTILLPCKLFHSQNNAFKSSTIEHYSPPKSGIDSISIAPSRKKWPIGRKHSFDALFETNLPYLQGWD